MSYFSIIYKMTNGLISSLDMSNSVSAKLVIFSLYKKVLIT